MLPRFDRRRRLVLGACAAAQVAVVAVVAATKPTSGTLSVVAALLLAPVAVIAVGATAARFAGGRFPPAAAVAYVLLPLLANRYLLAPYRGAFDRSALPALLGLRSTGVFALGVAAIVLTSVLPERIAAVCGAVLAVVALLVWSPGALGDLQPVLHETAWSVALPEWLVVATITGAVVRRPFLGVAIASIAVATILRAVHQPLAGVGFWSALGPLVPTAAVLLCSLWFLVPRLRPARTGAAAG